MTDTPEQSPRRAQTTRRPATAWLIAGAALVVALTLLFVFWPRPAGPVVAPEPSATAGPATSTPASPSSTSPSPSAADPRLAGCAAPAAEGFVPTRFQMTNPPADEEVLSLGLDDQGQIAAPPKNLPRTASWWNQGPRPGSDAGKVVMSIHTYRNGGALGNEMFDGEPTMKPGDLITLTDAQGNKACYEFVEARKISVEDYDPDSDVMVDFDGPPLLTIIICWDFNKETEDWDSRVFFYAKPVHA